MGMVCEEGEGLHSLSCIFVVFRPQTLAPPTEPGRSTSGFRRPGDACDEGGGRRGTVAVFGHFFFF